MSLPRNATFKSPPRLGFADHAKAELKDDHVTGALPFLNPTHALFDLKPAAHEQTPPGSGVSSDTDNDKRKATVGQSNVDTTNINATNAQVAWRARDNRKGRHILLVDPQHCPSRFKAICSIIFRMCTVIAWWDISWWIAVLFTFGSILFMVSGCYYWLPIAFPPTLESTSAVGGGVTGFVGGILFEIGGILLIVEVINEHQSGCFGWAIERKISGAGAAEKDESWVLKRECEHHHMSGLHKAAITRLQHPTADRKWEWWPTWHEFTGHYIHEIGFLANAILLIGASIFFITTILSLPGVYPHLSQDVLWGIYWLTYLIGALFFVWSSALYMLECQKKWWKPAFGVIGWWIGFWNMVGSIGWTLSASLGYCGAHWCSYQGNLTLLWASTAFLIGSLLLWYEAIDKFPVASKKESAAARAKDVEVHSEKDHE